MVVLAAHGKHFCAGIDLSLLASVPRRIGHADAACAQEKLRHMIADMQDCVSAIERCRKPVIAAIQGACIGGGVDIVTACDMRYANANARFAVREIDMAMAADIGTLQRLPRLVPEGIARELAFTGREIGAEEAARIGFAQSRLRKRRGADRGRRRGGTLHRRQVAAGSARHQGGTEPWS